MLDRETESSRSKFRKLGVIKRSESNEEAKEVKKEREEESSNCLSQCLGEKGVGEGGRGKKQYQGKEEESAVREEGKGCARDGEKESKGRGSDFRMYVRGREGQD